MTIHDEVDDCIFIFLLILPMFLIGCTIQNAYQCDQVQLNAVTQTVKDIQMNRTMNEIINMPEQL